ncbi:MAG: TonB family protein, partial [Bacteroidota bacterium]|nr:TonB family protein [Bacteroidota bacterium]
PQELTPAQEFIADEELNHSATGPADKTAKTESRDVVGPVSRAATEEEREVSQALQGKVAGVETNEAKKKPDIRRSTPAPTLVKGKVRSADGLGLPGVNVLVEGTNHGAVTDSEGNFQLIVPNEDTRLQFAFIGFESQVVDVPDPAQLDITLKEDATSLSEVVVTGYSGEGTSDDSEPFRFAEPDGGRADFKKYLASAVKYPVQAITNKVEGKVTVRFAVEATGQLTDFDIVKGIGSGCEEELIRAIRQGPSWKPSKRGTQPVRDKVSVRYRFKLPE